MDKQGKGAVAIVLVLIVIGLLGFIAYKVYFPTGAVIGGVLEPKLSVSGVSFEPDFGLSKGCSTKVEGYVSNVGNANANGVSVTCRLIGSGGGSTRGTKNVGSITSGGNSYFSMIINNDCPKPDDVQCSAVCQNCK